MVVRGMVIFVSSFSLPETPVEQAKSRPDFSLALEYKEQKAIVTDPQMLLKVLQVKEPAGGSVKSLKPKQQAATDELREWAKDDNKNIAPPPEPSPITAVLLTGVDQDKITADINSWTLEERNVAANAEFLVYVYDRTFVLDADYNFLAVMDKTRTFWEQVRDAVGKMTARVLQLANFILDASVLYAATMAIAGACCVAATALTCPLWVPIAVVGLCIAGFVMYPRSE